MPKWSWLGLLGMTLFVPGALYWTWIWISGPLQLTDAIEAFRRLASVPLSSVGGGRGLEVTVAIPNDAPRRRILRSWGDPGYFIGAVSPGPRRRAFCLKDLGVEVKAGIGDQPLHLEDADAPYGYSHDCQPEGLLFRAPPGSTVKIRFVTVGQPIQAADLIVEPHWTVGTKDRLVGINIEEQLHLRALAAALCVCGIIIISIAAVLFRHRPPRPLR